MTTPPKLVFHRTADEASAAFHRDYKDGTIVVHPSADLFPMMPDEALAELAADIKKDMRLRTPVLIDQYGRLVDGRNRIAAVRLLDDPQVSISVDVIHRARTLGGSGKKGATLSAVPDAQYEADILSRIITANIHRRHMTASQINLTIAKMVESTGGLGDPIKARIAALAKTFGGSVSGVYEARSVTDDPQAVARIVDGTSTVREEANRRKESTSGLGAGPKPATTKVTMTVRDNSAPATTIPRPEVRDTSAPAYTAVAVEGPTETFQTPADALMVERRQEAQAGMADALAAVVLAVPSAPAPAPSDLPPHAMEQVLEATDQDMGEADRAACAIQKIIDDSPAFSTAILDALFKRNPTLATIARQLTATTRSGSDRR